VVFSALIYSQNLISDEIKSRIAASNRCFSIVQDKYLGLVISKAVKIKIHATMVKTAVVFGSETWAMAERDVTRLGTWERKVLRTVHGTVGDQGLWRIRINKVLREIYKDLDIVADIKLKRLEWTGHVVRMDQGRTVQKIFESKPEGRRRKGRPRLRWLKDVGKDLREMKVKRWRYKAVDKEEWASVINKGCQRAVEPRSK